MRRGSRGSAIAVCAGSLFLSLPAWPQSAPEPAPPVPPARPRIGVALAGGGAKGAAHIGVLKTLEEMNVPIDYIAGTSMGSIIGGLYASGMSADELRDTILAVDWDDAMTDKPRRQDLAFRRKEEDRRYLFDLEAGIRKKGGVRFPSGLRAGQKLGFLLQHLTRGAASTYDFDDLPIPFRAVATDIHTGDPVVLDHGSLAAALRASMAIPGVFTAVELDGLTLVDGGISNNVPVDVVRAMGADIVIAVDLRLPEREDIESYVQITSQLSRLMTRKNMEARLALADIVIHPETAGYTTLGFDKVGELVELGKAQAEAQRAELQPLAIPAEDYARYRAGQLRTPPPPPVVTAIRFAGNERVDERLMRPYVDIEVGKPLDYDALSHSLLQIYGLGWFQHVTFGVEPKPGTGGGGEPAEAELVLRVKEKPWGPHYLHTGLLSSSGVGAGEGRFNFLVNLTSGPLSKRGRETRVDLVLGALRLVSGELYEPLSFEHDWFVAPRAELRFQDLSVFEDGNEIAVLDMRLLELSTDLGYQFGSFAEARLGLVADWVNLNVKTGDASLTDDEILSSGLAARWTLDRLDSATIPHDGTLAELRARHNAEALGSDDEYTKVSLAIANWETIGRGFVFGSLQAGVSPGGDLPIYAQFDVGGLLSLSGFDDRELLGNEFGIVRLGYYHRVSRKSTYAGGWLEAGNVWSSEDDVDVDDLITTATAALLVDSQIGPVILAYGRADTGDDKVYLAIGRSF